MRLRERRAEWPAMARVALAGMVVAGLAGCAATRSVLREPAGFLGDYSTLEKVKGNEAYEVSVADDVDWENYHAIHIDSVTLWATGTSAGMLSYEEQQMLTDLLYDALYEKLSERFLMAQQSGPQTIEVRAAITEARGANVPLNVATTVAPQLRPATTFGTLGLDTTRIVDSSTVEIEARDSLSYRRLAAGVDSRAGKESVQHSLVQWTDIEAAADVWAERVRDFFVRQGVTQRN
jgi:hypothetical protein